MSDEPAITVNGTPLSVGQAMTVRVALTSFLAQMDEEGALGDDEHGVKMRKAYRQRGTEVLRLMIRALK